MRVACPCTMRGTLDEYACVFRGLFGGAWCVVCGDAVKEGGCVLGRWCGDVGLGVGLLGHGLDVCMGGW